ncbi:beta-ketoacyl synthase N-terminal-like domain-containing protein [Streptomyces eurythermus]|uniref:beta-ketoacyl synthase N-terminal-like domain-containing protein n=1 Tax=Streptomyces eurythermus TaxID=42237 RepID=UPI0036BE3E4C
MKVFVTGLGIVAPNGVGVDAYWQALLEGRSVIDRITRYDPGPYPLKLAGEVREENTIERRVAVQTDRFTQFALTESDLALQDGKLDLGRLDPFGVGVVTASCSGGVEFGQREIERLWHQGSRYVGPYQSIAWFYAASTGQVSIRHGLKGACGVLVTDEAGGLDALGHARRDLGRGMTAMLAGGAEAPLAPFSMTCQYHTGLLSYATEPAQAYLPFTRQARGYVPAEGGAMVLLETEEAALRRGASPRAVIAGHGSTFTGSGRYAESAEGLEHAARIALDDAGLTPDQVDVVFADGLGVRAADEAEARAFGLLFGGRSVPVTVPKAGFGRAYAGAAVLDAAAAVLCVQHGVIPPTPHVPAGDHGLDLVTGTARTSDVRTALVLARGLAGGNSALVVRRAAD